MKIRFFIYTIILVTGVGLFMIWRYPSQSFDVLKIIAPSYACKLQSGQRSELTFDKDSICSAQNCVAVDIVYSQPTKECFDCGVYTYTCVPTK